MSFSSDRWLARAKGLKLDWRYRRIAYNGAIVQVYRQSCLCEKRLDPPESSLDNFKASAKTSSTADDPIFNVELDVLVLHLAMTFRCIIVPHNSHGSHYLYALLPGVDNYDRVAFMLDGIGRISHGQHEVDYVSWITSTRDPLMSGLVDRPNAPIYDLLERFGYPRRWRRCCPNW